MGAITTFNPAAWKKTYEEFAGASDEAATNFFMIATTMFDNTGRGPVADLDQQTALLFALTAHVAKLLQTKAGQAPKAPPGRIASASEGSVSASFDFPVTADSAWFALTTYGQMFWQMTAHLRTGRYRPGFRRTRSPFGYYGNAAVAGQQNLTPWWGWLGGY